MVKGKQYFRCTVCGDIHYGLTAPMVCPTCASENAYVPVEEREPKMIEFGENTKAPSIKVKDQVKIWDRWTLDKNFKLNPDKIHTETATEGAIENEKKTGLKYCPCRLRTGDFEKDIDLICPCNFKIMKTWQDKGMCWCGLFVRK